MIIEESKCRLLNYDEVSEEDMSIPLIMYSHPFLQQIPTKKGLAKVLSAVAI
jgi:hypothetical protein